MKGVKVAAGSGFMIRHAECGGQVMVGGEIRSLVDFGFGFRKRGKRRGWDTKEIATPVGPLSVDRKYSKKVTGYSGCCMKCRAEGQFMLEGVA